jgi:hypothetical protein
MGESMSSMFFTAVDALVDQSFGPEERKPYDGQLFLSFSGRLSFMVFALAAHSESQIIDVKDVSAPNVRLVSGSGATETIRRVAHARMTLEEVLAARVELGDKIAASLVSGGSGKTTVRARAYAVARAAFDATMALLSSPEGMAAATDPQNGPDPMFYPAESIKYDQRCQLFKELVGKK